MGTVNCRNGKLYLDFSYRGQRCREQTKFIDNPANRKRLSRFLEMIEAEIRLAQFKYGKYFPNSKKLSFFEKLEVKEQLAKRGGTVKFEVFAESWFDNKKVEWRDSQIENVRGILDKHIYPFFNDITISEITRQHLLTFRAELCQAKKPGGKSYSNSRINHILSPLKMIMEEAAEHCGFESPWRNIKKLSVERTDISPFTLDEVMLILRFVRKDFKNYFTVRFFTGLRTGEIDGLTWEQVDLTRKQLLIKHALVNGKIEKTKTNGSYRIVDLSEIVVDALEKQFIATGEQNGYVFCNTHGNPLDHRNVTKRVWYPLLRLLKLKSRNPYQTRHTAATLWLAAGESPEWIAKQLGHSTTTMLFTVYSRYVPNITRQDGSAFESLIKLHLGE